MSALEEALPEATDAGFRACFFFSFLGLIVSVLGLVRRLPPGPGPTALATRDVCGTFLTSSVSTVMLRDELSPDVCPLLPNLRAELDCRVCSGGAGAGARGLLVPALTLPLSLPLSLFVVFVVLVVFWLLWTELPGCVSVVAPRAPGAEPSGVADCSSCPLVASASRPGVFGWLTSCTVSRVADAPVDPLLGPRVGVLMPGAWRWSSASLSDAGCVVVGSGLGDGVARWTLMTGGSCSCWRVEGPGVVRARLGGGDFSRGDMGHRGASLDVSEATRGFCGTGDRSTGPELDGVGSTGVAAGEFCCREEREGVERLSLRRGGLGSLTLPLRDAVASADVRLGPRCLDVGEASLDCTGEAVMDDEVEGHLDVCVSMLALEGTEVSLSRRSSMEFRLETLASRPAFLSAKPALLSVMAAGVSGVSGVRDGVGSCRVLADGRGWREE
ncbi:hypothetical protein GGR56DRAFT_654053 [Xylariaceae sp. FL0804]|nr:hypothetical protein GGR56DRAFT_654053 [Xylariaceae sp. FL0804]